MLTQHLIHFQNTATYIGKEQKELLFTVFTKSIAESLVAIYVPIYLLTNGVSVRSVFLYYVLAYLTLAFSMMLAQKSNQVIGAKKTLVIGVAITALFYYCLHSLTDGIDFRSIAILNGIALGFYFGAYNVLLSHAMKTSTEGKSYTLQQLTAMFAGVIGPLLGALFIQGLSFQSLFLIVIVVLLIAPVPLFFSTDFKMPSQPLKASAIFTRKISRVDRATFLYGINSAAAIFWPAYIYLHYPHIIALGIFASLSSGAIILVTYIVGAKIDQDQDLGYGAGAVSHASSWISRLLFITPAGLVLNSFIGSITAIGSTMAVNKDIFHVAKISNNESAHFVRTEFLLCTGRVFVFGSALLIANVYVLFVAASAAALLFTTCRIGQVRRSDNLGTNRSVS
jgi:hypothetical protein